MTFDQITLPNGAGLGDDDMTGTDMDRMTMAVDIEKTEVTMPDLQRMMSVSARIAGISARASAKPILRCRNTWRRWA